MKLDIYDLQSTAYFENMKKVRNGQMPCLICGRGVDTSKKHVAWVHLHGGGSTIITEDEDGEDLGGPAADMWGYPIGPDCYKRHKDVLEPFVTKS